MGSGESGVEKSCLVASVSSIKQLLVELSGRNCV